MKKPSTIEEVWLKWRDTEIAYEFSKEGKSFYHDIWRVIRKEMEGDNYLNGELKENDNEQAS